MKLLRKGSRFLVLCLLLPGIMVTGNANEEAWIQSQFAKGLVPGAAVTVVRPDRPPEIYAMGLCDIEPASLLRGSRSVCGGFIHHP